MYRYIPDCMYMQRCGANWELKNWEICVNSSWRCHERRGAQCYDRRCVGFWGESTGLPLGLGVIVLSWGWCGGVERGGMCCGWVNSCGFVFDFCLVKDSGGREVLLEILWIIMVIRIQQNISGISIYLFRIGSEKLNYT